MDKPKKLNELANCLKPWTVKGIIRWEYKESDGQVRITAYEFQSHVLQVLLKIIGEQGLAFSIQSAEANQVAICIYLNAELQNVQSVNKTPVEVVSTNIPMKNKNQLKKHPSILF